MTGLGPGLPCAKAEGIDTEPSAKTNKAAVAIPVMMTAFDVLLTLFVIEQSY